MWKAVGQDPVIIERNFDDLSTKHPDSMEEIRLIHAGLVTIGQLIHDSPLVNEDGAIWRQITSKAKVERSMLCKHLEGKVFFTAMLHLYTTMHRELRDSHQPEPEQEELTEEFCEQRRHKQNPSDEQPAISKKTASKSGSVRDPRI
jgi:hypothetical protein